MTIRYRGRFLDYINGQKAFAFACGKDWCHPARMQGRFIDVVDGYPVYAVASECRHPTEYKPLHYVDKACTPPFGLTNVIKIQINLISTPANNCWGSSRCPTVELTWDGTSWKGTFILLSGSLGIEFKCVSGVYSVVFSGCIVATVPAVQSCDYPFIAGGGAPIPAVDTSCCDGFAQPTTNIVFTVWSYTLWRFVGRFVDIRSGLPVYSISECCEPPHTCPLDVACCGCEASPLQWTFDVTGVTDAACVVCTLFNDTWIITYSSTCTWTADHAGICTPGTPWTLACFDTVWRLSTSSFLGAAAVYEIPVADWLCFGPNTLTKVQDHAACSTFPSTITLNAV